MLSMLCAVGEAHAQSVFTHQIPIKLPKGANGVQPDLALVFSPNTTNGLLGVGWDLTGLSSVARVNYGNGINYAGADTYGHSQIGVLVSQTDGSYRSKRESFTRLVPSGTCGDGPCSWIAYDRSGTKFHYGSTTDSRLLKQGSASVRVWGVSKVEDVFGNWYEVAYYNDWANGQLFPALITYTKGPGLTTYRTVEFAYSDRTDIVPSYVQGPFEQLKSRLGWVTVKSAGTAIRTYVLAYECGTPNPNGSGDPSCPASLTGRSRLKSVTESGAGGSLQQQFTWQVGQAGLVTSSAYANPSPLPVGRDSNVPTGWRSGHEFVDLNADGKLDIIQGLYVYGTSYRYAWINNGNGWTYSAAFAPPADLAGRDGSAPGGWDSGLRIADVNADGRPDLIRGWYNYGTSYRQAWINNGGNCSTAGCAWTYAPGFAPAADFTGRDGGAPWGWDSGLRLADLTADGKPDLIQGWYNCGTSYRNAWINTGSGWSQSTSYAPAANFTGRQDGLPGGWDAGVRLADLNGDGRPDLIQGSINVPGAVGTTLRAWLNNGAGWTENAGYSPPVNFILFSNGGLDSGLRLVDVNMDGKADLLKSYYTPLSYPTDFTAQAWINNGSGWVENQAWAPPAAFSAGGNPETGARVVDVNGDGRPDMIYGYQPLLSYPTTTRRAWVNNGSGWTSDDSYAPPDAFVATLAQFDVRRCSTGLEVADLNGDGRPDYMQGWYKDGTTYRNGWLVPGTFPDLLTQINNGVNGSISLTYAPAPQVSGAIVPTSTAPGMPNTAPQQLVTRVVTSDGRGGSYAARHEYYDARLFPGTIPERRSLGFGRHTAVDEQTGQYTTTLFNQSPGYEGTVSIVYAYTGAGQVMSKTENWYDLVHPSQGTEFVRETQTMTSAYELGAFAFKQWNTTTYDDFGNPTVKSQFADGLPTVTVTTSYSNDTWNWVLGRITGVKTTSGATLLGEVRNTWNNNVITTKSEWLDSASAWVTKTMSYDGNGNLASVTEPPAGDGYTRTTTTEYDATFRAYPVKVVNALGHVTRKAHTADGLVASSTDADGHVTTYTYDALGRRLTETRPDGGTTTWFYVSWGTADQHTRVETKVDARVLYTYEYFDGTGFKYQVRKSADCPATAGLPAGLAAVDTQKDYAGRAYRTSQPYCYGTETPVFTTTTYEAAGRMSIVLTPDGKTTSYAYGPTSVAVTDANGSVTTRHYDARKRVTSIVDAANQTTGYGYDAMGRLTSATLPNGEVSTISYDSLNRRTSVTAPQLGTTTYTYDVLGNVRSVASGGKVVTFSYDALNRVMLKQPQGEPAVVYTYDEPAYANAIGRLTTVVDAGGTRHFSYTSTGALNATTLLANGSSYSQGLTYDLGSRVTRMTYPNGSYADYTYTAGGNLSTLSLDGNTVATWSNYDASGKHRSAAYGNGVGTTYTYDTMGHMTELVTSQGSTRLQDLLYDWYSLPDTGGMQIGSITDRRANKWVGGYNTDESQTYTYDALYRLTCATGVWGTKAYAYDAIGNVTTFGGVVDRTLVYDGQRVVSGTGLGGVTYDSAGNITAKVLDGTAWKYAWTTEGNLASVTKNDVLTAEMTYDTDGNRVKKVYSSSSRRNGLKVTTTYFGNIYEKRTYTDGSPERHTLHLYGNGHLVASVTREGVIPTASLTPSGWRTELAAASMYDARSIVGAVSMVRHLLAAVATHPRVVRWVALGVFALFALGLFGHLVVSLARRVASGFSSWLRLGSASLAIVVAFTACSGSGSGGIGRAREELLTGDTKTGPAIGTFYYHRNHINSSSVVTDAYGAEVTRIVYLPFGETSEPNSAGVDTVTSKYTGKELDEETGLYNYGARYYDAAIGRFMSPDSIVPSVTDAQSFNHYSYVRNNPVVYVDPTGHLFEFIGNVFQAIGNAVAAIGDAVVAAVKWIGDVAVRLGAFIASAANHAWHVIQAMAHNPFAIAAFVVAVGLSIATSNPGPLLLWAKASAAAIGAQSLAVAAGVRNPMVLNAIAAIAGFAAGAASLGDFLKGVARIAVDQAVARIDNKWVRLALAGAIIVGSIVANRLNQDPARSEVVDPGDKLRGDMLVADASSPGESDTATDACLNCVDVKIVKSIGIGTKWQRMSTWEKTAYVITTGMKLAGAVGFVAQAIGGVGAAPLVVGALGLGPLGAGLLLGGVIAFGILAIGITIADIAVTTTNRTTSPRRVRRRRRTAPNPGLLRVPCLA
jgi:RHS repeat-associated protein